MDVQVKRLIQLFICCYLIFDNKFKMRSNVPTYSVPMFCWMTSLSSLI